MTNNSTKSPVQSSEAETAVHLLDDWFDPIEAGLRGRVRELIQTMIESELETVLSRPRYARRPTVDREDDGAGVVTGHRHGHRSRSLLGTFGRVEIAVPRARLDTAEGKTTEWKSKALRAYQRRTQQVDSLIAGDHAPSRSRANLRPPSRSASVIDPLLKNQNPLENWNNLRPSSPHLVVGKRPGTAPQFCGPKFMDTGTISVPPRAQARLPLRKRTGLAEVGSRRERGRVTSY